MVSGFRSVAGVKLIVVPEVVIVPAIGMVPSFKIRVDADTSEALAVLLKVTAITGLITTVSA